ncbi:hypothetical protein N9137_03190 [Pseudomonadales bacterium]|nr:hypothetical protein [Pseudomonadales bacterium]
MKELVELAELTKDLNHRPASACLSSALFWTKSIVKQDKDSVFYSSNAIVDLVIALRLTDPKCLHILSRIKPRDFNRANAILDIKNAIEYDSTESIARALRILSGVEGAVSISIRVFKHE